MVHLQFSYIFVGTIVFLPALWILIVINWLYPHFLAFMILPSPL
jgi:hypothetical protein